jgi:hypothetical protein
MDVEVLKLHIGDVIERVFVEERSKQRDGVPEGDVFVGHEEVDGIEVLVTAKAPGEVGLRIDG